MRIAVVVGVFPTVSETFVLNQVTGLIDRGHDVRIFAARLGRPAAIHDEIISYRLMDRARHSAWLPAHHPHRSLVALPLLAKALFRRRANGARLLSTARFGFRSAPLELLSDAAAFQGSDSFDVVLCHHGPMGARVARLREAGVVSGRVVTVFHGSDASAYVRRVGSHAYAHLFATGDLFLPVSDHWRRRLIALGCPAERIAVHGMGVDCRRFAFARRERRTGEPLRLVTVARLVERKGVANGIRAAAELVRSGVDVEYTIVGDGPLSGVLVHLARELGISQRVRIIGSVSHGAVAAILARSHVMVAPSVTAANGDMEGIPVAMMEAMASGLPVVSTIHSGIPELIEDDVTGYLVPEGDAGALAARLSRLARDFASTQRVSTAARRVIVQRHDIDKLNDRLVRHFDALMSGGGKPSLTVHPASAAVGIGAARMLGLRGRGQPAVHAEDAEG
ncbi:MAG TPA: glycosyltransferase [Gemmatimonadaceae bacterium]|nr:glycosyltransferase [Gemmatimonadaceae bacterium]